MADIASLTYVERHPLSGGAIFGIIVAVLVGVCGLAGESQGGPQKLVTTMTGSTLQLSGALLGSPASAVLLEAVFPTCMGTFEHTPPAAAHSIVSTEAPLVGQSSTATASLPPDPLLNPKS